MVVAAIALQIWLIKISILQRVFCLVGAGFILWLMFWGIDKSGIKQQKKMYEKNSGSRMGMTSSSGIHLKFTNADIDFKWENFVDYRMLNQLLVLIDVDKQFLGLASYMFSSKGDWESFVRIVEHNLKKI